MENYLSNIDWGGTCFWLIMIILGRGLLLTVIENFKIKKDSFKSPEVLDLNAVNKWYKIKELDGDKVLLQVLFSGWHPDIGKFTDTEIWFKKEGIPENLLTIGEVFWLVSSPTGLIFS